MRCKKCSCETYVLHVTRHGWLCTKCEDERRLQKELKDIIRTKEAESYGRNL
jgi:hypothetical protein